MTLSGKRILIGITGGISAYKTLSLIRELKKANCEVKVILSPMALQFVTTKTIETLSENPCYTSYDTTYSTEHISLEKWADLFVIAPATLNTISKITCSIADNLLTSVAAAYMGSKKPLILAPAMNKDMLNNSLFNENLKKISKYATIIEPEFGHLACNEEGKGRMADISKIYDTISQVFSKQNILSGKKIIVTSGGTKEFIDPVRIITNLSSGKMGTSLADVAYSMGADVHLITTIDVDKNYKVTKVNTADEMKEAIIKDFPSSDTLIMASAVCDYKILKYNEEKIKSDHETLTLEFVKNVDILKEVSKIKKENQTIVGFSLSTSNTIQNAIEKIDKKKCDFIVANDSTALNSDENEVVIIDKKHNQIKLEKDFKINIAEKILGVIYDKNR